MKKKKSLLTVVRPDVLSLIVNKFTQGFNHVDVLDMCIKSFPELPIGNIQRQITEAKRIIKDQYQKDLNSVVGVHSKRYELEIQRLLRYVPSSAIYEKSRMQTIENYLNLLDVIQHKEKLYGLHNKSINILINNQLNVQINISKFDLSKLEMAEKIELLNLIEKSKKTESEVFGIIKASDNKNENITNIDFEEVIPEPINIESINQTNIAPLLFVEPNNALENAKDKLKAALKKKAEELFENKSK